MKRLLILLLPIFVTCGPSEEEVQNRIDEAVKSATSTSTTTTLPEKDCTEYIFTVIDIFACL